MIDRCYYQAGDVAKGDALAKEIFAVNEKDLIYYNTLTGFSASYYSDFTQQYESILESLGYYSQLYKRDALEKEFQSRLESLNKLGLLKGQQRQ